MGLTAPISLYISWAKSVRREFARHAG